MNRFVKTCVLWMMMLALPMQVQASVTQVSCEIGHQRSPAAQAQPFSHAASARKQLRLKRQHQFKVTRHGKPVKTAAVQSAQEDHTSCAPCVACCTASATMTSMQIHPQAPECSDARIAVLPDSPPGFIPEGLERPPRTIAS